VSAATCHTGQDPLTLNDRKVIEIPFVWSPASAKMSVKAANDLGETEISMGGNGSGWRGPKREIVEDCLILPISDLIRDELIVPGSLRSGSLEWRYERGAQDPIAWLNYEADLRNLKNASMGLQYIRDGKPVVQWVWLSRTQPHYGGYRWWFRCPSLRTRVAKLYLPPSGNYFASRKAHGLTYRSCQWSGLFERLRQVEQRPI